MAFPSVFTFNNLDGRNGFFVDSIDPEDDTGSSVDIAGDINGDGFDDVIVGAPGADPNGESSGAAYVLFGSAAGFDSTVDPSSLDGSNGFVVNGVSGTGESTPGDRAGALVSRAGDVNGDGIDDFLVGANVGLNGIKNGEVYVVYGSQSGFDASLELSELNGSNGFTITSNTEAEGVFLESISDAGDINGDGFDDVIIGTPTFTSDVNSKSYVVFGSGSPVDTPIALASLDGSNGFVINRASSESFDDFGQSVSAVGDINNDGIDDVVIGAAGAGDRSNALYSTGESYVLLGSTDGFDASIDVLELNGSNGFVIRSGDVNTSLGASISDAGDVNGDGISDLIMGAPDANLTVIQGRFSTRFVSAGESYVLFGREDGFGDTVNLASLDGSNGFVIEGTAESDDRLGSLVSAAGDLNDDGFDDVIIGGAFGEPSYVVYGKGTGFAPSIEIDSLADEDGFTLSLGFVDSAGGGGDVNGDGVDDLVAGNDSSLTFEGVSTGGGYVVYGRGDNPPSTPFVEDSLATLYVDAENIVVGRSAEQAGALYQGALISNTDTTREPNDVIVGTEGDDFIDSGSQGDDVVIAGAGNDIIDLGDRTSTGTSNSVEVDAGAGDDFVYMLGDNSPAFNVELGSGNDSFYAPDLRNGSIASSSGNNLISINVNATVTTGDGDDFVYTTKDESSGSGTLNLGDGDNTVWLQQGNFTITTGSGDDSIGLGRARGSVNAGDGDNIIYVVDSEGPFDGPLDIVTGSGNDYIQTERQDDIIDGGTGFNTLLGGEGSDTFVVRTDAYNFIGDFEAGVDFIRLADVSFDELSFFQGSSADGNEANAFIFAEGAGFVEVANTTVAVLDDAASFV